MKTLFFVVPNGVRAANMLRTSVLERLLSIPEVRLVIASPLALEPHFISEFSAQNITLEPLSLYTPSRLRQKAMVPLLWNAAARIPTSTLRIKSAGIDKIGAEVRGIQKVLRRTAMRAVGMIPLPRPLWFYLQDRLIPDGNAASLLARYSPDVLIVPTAGLSPSEVPFIRQARRRGIPTIAVDLSWDHLSAKEVPIRRVTKLLVWNEIMRQEAVALHGYGMAEVVVTGVPHFDLYFGTAPLAPRKVFLRRIGARPDDRLVTVATIAPRWYPHYPDVVELLYSAIRAGKLGENVHLLVRLDARDDPQTYARFAGLAGLTVEWPYRRCAPCEGIVADPSREDRRHLAETMLHSDVVVNVSSTITLEACAVNTPVVNLAFDGHARKSYSDSIRKVYDFTHYRPVIERGAVRMASAPEELVRLVQLYLDCPDLDRTERQQLVQDLCTFTDGHSADRVAAEIRGMLEGSQCASARPWQTPTKGELSG